MSPFGSVGFVTRGPSYRFARDVPSSAIYNIGLISTVGMRWWHARLEAAHCGYHSTRQLKALIVFAGFRQQKECKCGEGEEAA